MLGNVTGCPPEDVFVGMPVHAVFEPRDGYTAVQFEPTENVSHQVREGGRSMTTVTDLPAEVLPDGGGVPGPLGLI